MASPNPAVRRYFVEPANGGLAAQAAGGAEALTKLATGDFRWLLLDRNLPDLNADEVARMARRRFPQVRVVMVHAAPQPRTQRPRPMVAASMPDLPCSPNSEPPPSRAGANPLPGMIGQSDAMLHLYRMARLVATHDTTVLITGETGTGKELVARAIHELSARSRGPLVIVNCAAIPESLLESELFGHMRGAFTGAVQSQLGRFQAAQGGTLFLDEIGELPLSLQPKLLRFLESKELQRLGSPAPVRIDARVIAATNADLERSVSERRFREDLFYRLSGFCIDVPPLRHRREDIPALARNFVEQLTKGEPAGCPQLTPAVIRALQNYGWRGNVRELQLVLEQACILADGDPRLGLDHLRFPRARTGALAVI